MSHIEREIKLAAPPTFSLANLSDTGSGVVTTPVEAIDLDATYFDTDDLRLVRAGATVRYRNDEGWVVKLPVASGTVLTRAEHRFAGGPATPPDPAVDLVRALTRGVPLTMVARLCTTRQQVRVSTPDGTGVATLVDDTVRVTEGAAAEPAFREIEVELLEDSVSHHADLLAKLRAAGAGAPDPTPKLARALGPRAMAPPDVAVPAVPRREASVDLVVRAAIATGVDRLVRHDPGVRIGDDPENVHQARVATRRLRSNLRVFRELLDEQWAQELRDELCWLGDVLGGVRDADVLLDRLEAKIARLPTVDQGAADRLIATLRTDRERKRELLLASLRGERYNRLLDRLVLAARRPRLLLRVDDLPDVEILREVVRGPWRRLRDAVRALPDEPRDTELHNLRILVKRARYAAEAVDPAFGKPARAFARALTGVQDVLGEHQDAVLASEWLRRNAAPLEEAVGFAAGQLAMLEHADARRARDAWPAAWRRAERRRLRDWL